MDDGEMDVQSVADGTENAVWICTVHRCSERSKCSL